MEAIATWSTAESWLLNLYLELAGGNKSAAAEMFLTLESRSAKSAALNPLIHRLDGRYQTLYRAVAKLSRSRQSARDKLAHWVWGYSAQLPDALLLADPKALAAAKPDVADPSQNHITPHIYVYNEADFRSIIHDNEELAGYGFKFRWIVTNHISNRKDQLYHELCAQPAIADILHRPVPTS